LMKDCHISFYARGMLKTDLKYKPYFPYF